VGKLVPKTASCGLLGGNKNCQNGAVLGFWGEIKIHKTVPCWAFGGKWSPKRCRVGHLGENGPQNGAVLGFWGESGPQTASFLRACMSEASSTRVHDALSSVSFETETNKSVTVSETKTLSQSFLSLSSRANIPKNKLHSYQTLKLPQRDPFPCTRRHKSTRK
jgi:hypothetical protein